MAPTPWISREEKAEDAKRREDAELRGKMRHERDSKDEARQEAVKKASEEFENKLFTNIYQAHRWRSAPKFWPPSGRQESEAQSAGASPKQNGGTVS